MRSTAKSAFVWMSLIACLTVATLSAAQNLTAPRTVPLLQVSDAEIPIALRSVDIDSKEEQAAGFERTDTTAVPAAGVIGESMIALVLADAMREKFGGDSLGEMKRNFDGYREQLRGY